MPIRSSKLGVEIGVVIAGNEADALIV